MSSPRFPEPRSPGSRIEAVFTWLGGGHWRELGERHERSTHSVACVVVLLGAALAGLVAALVVAGSTRWPMLAILPVTLVFGLLVGAVTRAIPSGPTRGWPGIVGRGAVATVVSTSRPHATPNLPPPSRRQRPTSTGRATRAPRSTTRSNRPADTATRRWSSHAASTTPRRTARRPASPETLASGPKPKRPTSFSRAPSLSWTTPWPRVTAEHPSWTPRSPTASRRSRRHARPRDRHHDPAAAGGASGVRRGRGDHVLVQAHPQGDRQLRGEPRAVVAARIRGRRHEGRPAPNRIADGRVRRPRLRPLRPLRPERRPSGALAVLSRAGGGPVLGAGCARASARADGTGWTA